MAELKMNRENVRRRELRKENSASVILERQRAKRYYDATPEKQKIRGIRKGCMRACPEKEIQKAILAWGNAPRSSTPITITYA
jgi:hypothetical protein